MSRVIEITISPQGQVRLESHGFAGASCRDATQALEQALGVRQSEQLTAEFHTVACESQHLTQAR